MKIILTLFFILSPVLCQAQARDGLRIGLFGGVRQSEFLSEKNKTLILPAIQYTKGNFSFEGRSLAYQFLGNRALGLSVKADYFSAGFDPKKTPLLSDMSERKSSLHLGLEARARLSYGLSLRWSVSQDTLGRSEGFETGVGLSRFFFFGPTFQMIPSLSLTYWSRPLMDYYYGVGPMEATASRPSFAPRASVVPSAVILLTGGPAQSVWRVFMIASRTQLSDEQKRSPTTGRSSRDFLGLGVNRQF
jgi:outer membrane scaffolding protein for murein synthesis (MipA/OmpV family)